MKWYVAVLGVMIGSSVARNLDLWGHLATGRAIAAGQLSALSGTWLYDLSAYLLYTAGGGPLLVALKAGLVAAVGVLVFRLASLRAGPRLAAFSTALALVTIGHRVLLQPATVSYLFFALVAWLLYRGESRPTPSWLPEWRLTVVFLVWANTDRWVVLGLWVVTLAWVGRSLDRPGGMRDLPRRLAAAGVLALACTASPEFVSGLSLPGELAGLSGAPADAGGPPPPMSPFGRSYLNAFGDSPAARAYYVLLGLSAGSFILARRGWRWEAFLPWVAVVAVSGVQGRAVAFFAVVAGPVLAWNGAALAARPLSPRAARATGYLTAAAGGVLAVTAWPGWLLGPPYEPRRWAVERPVALERAAAVLGRWHSAGLPPAGSRTLHLSPELAGAFAWFGPDDPGVSAPALVAAVADAGADAATLSSLRASGISRVVIPVGGRARGVALLEQLLTVPAEWPLLHVSGGVAVFGWRDPERGGAADPFSGREVDFDRMAFRPAEEEKAPPAAPASGRQRWWEAFWRPAPPRPAGRDEAALLLLKTEVERLTAPRRHAEAWGAWHSASAIGTGAVPGAPYPAIALQLTLFAPPPPSRGGGLPPITVTAFEYQRRFAAARGDAPAGVLYAAVRAARRASGENTSDAGTYLVLGQCYRRLLDTTREQAWAAQFPLVGQIRQIQASAALNRAIALDPTLAQAHLELALLYRQMNCGDLAVGHLRTYRGLVAREGRQPDPAASDEVVGRLEQLLDHHTRSLSEEGARVPVADRARLAAERGLAGEALRLLLESDVSAFGTPGMRLELDVLLKTGRVSDVLSWTSPDLQGSLGSGTYHLVRAEAYLAAGDYTAAEIELTLVGDTQPGRTAGLVAGRAVLGARPGPATMPNLLWRALSEHDYRVETANLERTVAAQCDLAALRGLILLEAGEVDRACETFRSALQFTRPLRRVGGFSFPGRLLAEDGLAWLGRAGG